MVEAALKFPFILFILVATILTGLSMFTSGWRYTEATHEGVILGHYGNRLPWEKQVVSLLIAAFVFEILILIGSLFGFYKIFTQGFLYGLTILTFFPVIFLAAASIIYFIDFNEPYDYTVVYNGRPLSPREVAAMYPFSRGAYKETSLGYSYYLATISIIPLIIAAILYLMPAIRRQKRRHSLDRC
uniref:NADH dehydrogenase subunit 6 n=1 Tax=Acrobeloides nanus TaxID=290746 RepID=A0A914D0T1_9BILA